jgi:hypothetical protein
MRVASHAPREGTVKFLAITDNAISKSTLRPTAEESASIMEEAHRIGERVLDEHGILRYFRWQR